MAGNEQDMTQAIALNELLNWTPQAPVRLIHGDADSTVPYFNSQLALNYFKANGKLNVDLITIEGKDHMDAAEDAIILAVQWFERIK